MRLQGHLHSPFSRLVSGALVAVSRLSLPVLAVAGLLGDGDLLTTPVLVGSLLVFAVLPAAAAWMIERATAAEVAAGDDVVLVRPDLRLEVPRAAIDRVHAWALPVPGPGVSFALRSGRRLGHGLELADPVPLLAALGQERDLHPVAAWAHARAATPPWRWHHLLWKFGLFALAPTAVLFNAHQHIAYGGWRGQYYLEGPGPYFRTFAIYWLTVAIDLLLWAALWRAVGEVAALAAAWLAPSRAARMRHLVEVACRLVYYAGVPALLAARFLA